MAEEVKEVQSLQNSGFLDLCQAQELESGSYQKTAYRVGKTQHLLVRFAKAEGHLEIELIRMHHEDRCIFAD